MLDRGKTEHFGVEIQQKFKSFICDILFVGDEFELSIMSYPSIKNYRWKMSCVFFSSFYRVPRWLKFEKNRRMTKRGRDVDPVLLAHQLDSQMDIADDSLSDTEIESGCRT